MNKQEAIELLSNNTYRLFGSEDKGVPLEIAIGAVQLIHEPQKVVVPRFVAEWIEECKSIPLSLNLALNNHRMPGDVAGWLIKFKNQETFARAWLDGYEVEQEQLYTVEIPDPNSYCDYRYLSRNDNGICLDASNDTKWKQKKRNQFTESEIKQDFEWAWDAGFAEPVEVQEVES